MKIISALLIFLIASIEVALCINTILGGVKPEHVHLSLSSIPSQMNVAWWTSEPSAETSMVQYGKKSGTYEHEVPAVTKKIEQYGTGYMHFGTFVSLESKTLYYYRVGSGNVWSDEFSFRSKPNDKLRRDDNITMLAYGDMGVFQTSLEHLKAIYRREVENNKADIVLHVGDLAYAFENTTKWDMWFENAEPITAHIPYMVSYGNRDNRSVFIERFSMPLERSESNAVLKLEHSQNFYYSFDYGWVHVISITTIKEIFEYTPGTPQYEWLENDLRDASQRLHDSHENLRWIVLMGHTPLYSSSNGHTGGNKVLAAAIEHLLVKYNVSVALWGDDHMYERTYPIYNNQTDQPYKKVNNVQHFRTTGRPIHFLVGTGGIEFDGYQSETPPSWSAHREISHGYLKMVATKDLLDITFVRKDGVIGDHCIVEKSLEEGRSRSFYVLFLIPIAGFAFFYLKKR